MEEYINYVKISVAVACLNLKPKNMNVEEFLMDLTIQYRVKLCHNKQNKGKALQLSKNLNESNCKYLYNIEGR